MVISVEKAPEYRGGRGDTLVCGGLPRNADLTMIISCPECNTRYAVPDTAIGDEGRTVRCAKCKHSWFQEPLLVETAFDAAAPAPPNTKSPVIPKSSRPTSHGTGSAPPRVPATQAPDEGVAEPSPSEKDDEFSAPRATEAKTDPQTAAALASVADALREPDSGDSEEPTGTDTPSAEPSASEVRFDDAPIAQDYADPLADDEPEAHTSADDFTSEATPFDDDYQSPYTQEEESEDEVSHFEYRAPFTARRNPLKMWSIAAGVFALLAAATIGAINFYGLPSGLGLPFQGPSFGIGKPDLVLNFPEADQRLETLDTGVEIFRVRGTITNAGASESSVPRLVVVFIDDRGREVFSKIIVPAKSQLAPGESLNVTEGISDYPAAARSARLGWAPN